MRRWIIGVDPDTDKSGFGVVDNANDEVSVYNFDVAHSIDFIKQFDPRETRIFVEASWNNKHNYHRNYYDSDAVKSSKGYDVGTCHQTGKILVQIFRHMGYEVYEKTPFRKFWSGRGGKITHEEIVQQTKLKAKKSNQEQRDALLMAWFNR